MPKQLRVDIPEDKAETFGQFNILCVIRERRPVDYLAELIKDELRFHGDELKATWLNWEDFEREMHSRGFSFNRTTFWNYRTQGKFSELVKTDGVTTLYQLEGFLDYFKGETNGNNGNNSDSN